MAEYFLPILMIVSLIGGIFTGYPVAFLLAGLGVVFSFLASIPVAFLGTVVSRIFSGTLANWLLLAVPLFIHMGLMLEKSGAAKRSEEHTSELQSLMRISYAVFCLKQKKKQK